MKRNILLWQLWGFAFVSLSGTLLHFLYDWTGKSVFAAPFSGVNESTFEHMKLLYFPILIFAVFQSFFFKDDGRFWCIKLTGALTGLLLIPVIFYTLNGVFGKTPDWINITIFFVSALCSFLIELYLFKSRWFSCSRPVLALIILVGIGVLFVVFTFFPPMIPLFKDPIDGTYGIQQKRI